MWLSQWKFTRIISQITLLGVTFFHSAVCNKVAVAVILVKVHLLHLVTYKGHPKLLIDVLQMLVRQKYCTRSEHMAATEDATKQQ